MLAYYVFGVYGEKVLERFGHVLHVEEEDIERGQKWFRRWGENSVFWCRMLAVMRAVISIPVGMAQMDVKKFVAYSTFGSAVFNLAFTWLVFSGSDAHSPLDVMVIFTENTLSPILQSVQLTVLVGTLSVGGGWWVWRQRETITQRFEY